MKKTADLRFVVCIKNRGYQASLEPRKIYQTLPDDRAAEHGMIRVVDESGDDYLFPSKYFAPIKLPKKLIEALASAA